MYVMFEDSTDVSLITTNHACLYIDGIYNQQAYKGRFEYERWISDGSNGGAHFEGASILDYEVRNPCFNNPAAVNTFVDGRFQMGKMARTYCQRSLLKSLFQMMPEYLFEWSHWWIPTLDGYNWNPIALSNNIKQNWGVSIDWRKIWGNQDVAGISGQSPDRSNLFLPW
jgi:hypothetical protein